MRARGDRVISDVRTVRERDRVFQQPIGASHRVAIDFSMSRLFLRIPL
jgi:hypothetical protein